MELVQLELGSTALTTARALPSLVKDVAVYTFVEYRPTTSLSERLLEATPSLDAQAQINKIRELTENVVPNWEAVLAAAWGTRSFAVFAENALRHNMSPTAERIFTVSARDLSE